MDEEIAPDVKRMTALLLPVSLVIRQGFKGGWITTVWQAFNDTGIIRLGVG
jgi:hypothetical protein